MSTQRGNQQKRRPQKHQNATAFKNTLHDKSKKTMAIVSMDVSGVCQRCKDIIDWKIRYKKYKPLTVPKKCIKCENKSVKQAYHIICDPCVKKLHICGKCGKGEILKEPPKTAAEELAEEAEFEAELKELPERKRRTLLRYMASKKPSEEAESLNDLEKEECGSSDSENDDLSDDDSSHSHEDFSDTDDVDKSKSSLRNTMIPKRFKEVKISN